jgi:hypothetical protein
MIDLSKVDIFGNETGTINTANCYIVRKEGDYCFPLVYGNGIKNGKDNKEAYKNSKPENTLFFNYSDYKGRIITDPYIIKDKIGRVSVIWKSDGIEVENIECKNNYLYFSITKNNLTKQGENALIGIYDNEGSVIWSWHIWFYRGELEIIPIKDKTKYKKIPKYLQYQLLSINLGWNGEIGTFYQWGRKDPFRGDIEKVPIMENNLLICNSISNPDKFFINTNYDFNRYVNLWDSKCNWYVDEDEQYPNHSRLSIKTIYDPCPPGFKVPGCDVFEELLGSWWKKYGRVFCDSRLFLPASGYRNRVGGGLLSVSSLGCYWSSASGSQADAYYLYFSVGYIRQVNDSYRADGFSVRPIKEYG